MTTADPSNPPPAQSMPLPGVPPPLPTSLLVEPRVVPVGAAMQWIGTGWEMFKAAPGPWIGIVLTAFVVTMVLNVVPFVGLVNVVLQPILTAGVMAACEAQRTGTRPRLEHLFAGFQKHTGQLALVGVIYMLGVLLIIVLVGGGGFAAMLPFIVAASVGGDSFSIPPAMIGIIVLCVLLGMILVVPLGMAIVWAPALVYVHDMAPLEAIKRSFFACLRNWLAVIVLVVLSMVLTILAVIPLGLGLLVLGPVMFIAMWAAYREIFVA